MQFGGKSPVTFARYSLNCVASNSFTGIEPDYSFVYAGNIDIGNSENINVVYRPLINNNVLPNALHTYIYAMHTLAYDYY